MRSMLRYVCLALLSLAAGNVLHAKESRQIHGPHDDSVTSWIDSAAKSKPNILFLIVDDLRPKLGCYGETNMVTPNIDNLASKSVRFDRAYVQFALCSPSRTSLLTGRRPDTTHVYDLQNYFRKVGGNFTTLPEHFKNHGYAVRGFGKIFHPGNASGGNNDWPHSWTQAPYIGRSPGVHNLAVHPLNETDHGKLQDTDLADHAVTFLNNHHQEGDKKPFFLAVGFHKPHLPWEYPEQFKSLYPLSNIHLAKFRTKPPGMPDIAWSNYGELRSYRDVAALNVSLPYGPIPDPEQLKLRQAYSSAVSYTDSLVGRVLDALDKNGYANNTIITFIGDHGWQLGDDGEWCKHTDLEVATRIPYLVSVPGVTNTLTQSGHNYPFLDAFHFQKPTNPSKSLSTDALVEAVDLFPTILHLAGFAQPSVCPEDSAHIALCTEGHSLVPILKHLTNGSDQPILKWKDSVFWQYRRMKNGQPYMGYTIRTNTYRYTEWAHFNRQAHRANWTNVIARELYQHTQDPEEVDNLAEVTTHGNTVSSLSQQLHDGWRKTLQRFTD